ncbi:MAG: hypothetical protein MHMPM18_000875 [Marteilia pararefringens]
MGRRSSRRLSILDNQNLQNSEKDRKLPAVAKVTLPRSAAFGSRNLTLSRGQELTVERIDFENNECFGFVVSKSDERGFFPLANIKFIDK